MSRVAVKPYLVAKDADGSFRITVRTTRLNSQGYPLTSSKMLEQVFATATSARAHLRDEFRAQTDQIAIK